MLTLGVIGCGYWGPNLVRNFHNQPDTRVTRVADLSRERLQHMEMLYPSLETTQDHRELIEDPGMDAIVISTPVTTHYKLAKEALEAGKHVFLEKPLTHNAAESLELVKLAEAKGLVGMVGHTFLYSPAVLKIKELVDGGELGEVQYISTIRVNLGLFQDDLSCSRPPARAPGYRGGNPFEKQGVAGLLSRSSLWNFLNNANALFEYKYRYRHGHDYMKSIRERKRIWGPENPSDGVRWASSAHRPRTDVDRRYRFVVDQE